MRCVEAWNLNCLLYKKNIDIISCVSSISQYVTEKMGGAEGTKLDLDFMDMERKTDVTNELVEEIQVKTKEFLQPNPTARAKMAAVKGISKLSGQAKSNTYPQPEGLLADCMLMYGKKLGDNSIFGESRCVYCLFHAFVFQSKRNQLNRMQWYCIFTSNRSWSTCGNGRITTTNGRCKILTGWQYKTEFFRAIASFADKRFEGSHGECANVPSFNSILSRFRFAGCPGHTNAGSCFTCIFPLFSLSSLLFFVLYCSIIAKNYKVDVWTSIASDVDKLKVWECLTPFLFSAQFSILT